MTSRIRTFLTELVALLTTLLLAFTPVAAKPASGGYQLFESAASGDQVAISLASLENFDYHAKIAPECCNADKLGTLQIASVNNTLGMLQSCRDIPGSEACGKALAEARDYLEWSDGFGNLGEMWFNVSANEMGGVDADWGGNLDALAVDVFSGQQGTKGYQQITDRALLYDGRMNLAVGAGTVALVVVSCPFTSGTTCALGVAGAGLAEADKAFDGYETLSTGEASDGLYRPALRTRTDLSDETIEKIVFGLEAIGAMLELGAGGVATIKHAGKVTKVDDLSKLDDVVEEIAATGGGLPAAKGGGKGISAPNLPDYTPTVIGGRQYSSHALQRMDERGLTPSVVENTVDDAFLIGQGNRSQTLVYYDPINRVQVVTNYGGDVVTVIPGNPPKPGALAPIGD